ncbi:hypothetical protein ACFP4H_09420 [Pseudophaeobacter arcticus]|uniref:hypothetical protein n=1 Tax=Pseudophaeobacter arcticus TaxID=385492 RepID=UPI0012B5E147|nr:hypothetical protein [Pseudophaeobacter arcticus]
MGPVASAVAFGPQTGQFFVWFCGFHPNFKPLKLLFRPMPQADKQCFGPPPKAHGIENLQENYRREPRHIFETTKQLSIQPVFAIMKSKQYIDV